MQTRAILAAGVGLALTAALPAGPAAAQPEPPSTSSSRMIIMGEVAAERSAQVTILRGSAIGPKPLPEPPPDQWQLLAGKRLWVVNPATGELVNCRARNTSTVGLRVVGCTTGQLP
jgi:hypothetical protein